MFFCCGVCVCGFALVERFVGVRVVLTSCCKLHIRLFKTIKREKIQLYVIFDASGDSLELGPTGTGTLPPYWCMHDAWTVSTATNSQKWQKFAFGPSRFPLLVLVIFLYYTTTNSADECRFRPRRMNVEVGSGGYGSCMVIFFLGRSSTTEFIKQNQSFMVTKDWQVILKLPAQSHKHKRNSKKARGRGPPPPSLL